MAARCIIEFSLPTRSTSTRHRPDAQKTWPSLAVVAVTAGGEGHGRVLDCAWPGGVHREISELGRWIATARSTTFRSLVAHLATAEDGADGERERGAAERGADERQATRGTAGCRGRVPVGAPRDGTAESEDRASEQPQLKATPRRVSGAPSFQACFVGGRRVTVRGPPRYPVSRRRTCASRDPTSRSRGSRAPRPSAA